MFVQWIPDNNGWRICYFLLAFFGAIVFILEALLVPETLNKVSSFILKFLKNEISFVYFILKIKV